MEDLELNEIDTKIRKLRERRKFLLERKKMIDSLSDALSSRRSMLPMPDEIGEERIFAVTPLGYTIVREVTADILRFCFALDSWIKIRNALQRKLNCDSTDICVLYRTFGNRHGQRYPLFAFKHRFNSGMNEGMQMMRELGCNPRFVGDTKTWTVEENADSIAVMHRYLSCWFRYLIDMRAGIVYRAERESCFFRPNFTRQDRLDGHEVLNSLCTYVWKEMPEHEEELRCRWLEPYFPENSPHRQTASLILPLGVEISAYLHSGKVPGETGSAKEWIRKRFEDIIRK